ncbi:MAG: hypothetical protein AAF636_11415 [Pseudomonadota bacterium]
MSKTFEEYMQLSLPQLKLIRDKQLEQLSEIEAEKRNLVSNIQSLESRIEHEQTALSNKTKN